MSDGHLLSLSTVPTLSAILLFFGADAKTMRFRTVGARFARFFGATSVSDHAAFLSSSSSVRISEEVSLTAGFAAPRRGRFPKAEAGTAGATFLDAGPCVSELYPNTFPLLFAFPGSAIASLRFLVGDWLDPATEELTLSFSWGDRLRLVGGEREILGCDETGGEESSDEPPWTWAGGAAGSSGASPEPSGARSMGGESIWDFRHCGSTRHYYLKRAVRIRQTHGGTGRT